MNNPGWEQWFPQFLARHRDKLRHSNFKLLSQMASHALSAALLSTLAEEPELFEQEEFKRELWVMLVNYLQH